MQTSVYIYIYIYISNIHRHHDIKTVISSHYGDNFSDFFNVVLHIAALIIITWHITHCTTLHHEYFYFWSTLCSHFSTLTELLSLGESFVVFQLCCIS